MLLETPSDIGVDITILWIFVDIKNGGIFDDHNLDYLHWNLVGRSQGCC